MIKLTSPYKKYTKVCLGKSSIWHSIVLYISCKNHKIANSNRKIMRILTEINSDKTYWVLSTAEV